VVYLNVAHGVGEWVAKRDQKVEGDDETPVERREHRELTQDGVQHAESRRAAGVVCNGEDQELEREDTRSDLRPKDKVDRMPFQSKSVVSIRVLTNINISNHV